MNTTFGRYRLLDRLGQGGMAEVFKAKSYGVEGFEKVVVIKRILPELAQSDEFVTLFIHEAKLAVRLSHANIVQVFDLGLAPGTVVGGMPSPDAYYMAMEYVNGLDLASLLARTRRTQIEIPVEMAVYVAAEVAKGLDHAHRRRDEQNQPLNVVHLDVSPQNVLLSLEGEVKVTDFGIAKARGVLADGADGPRDQAEETRHRVHGKFGYMSPEHAAGAAVDARSDLFSLGTVLYEMLAGVNPFTAPTSFETLRRVQACEYPPVELLRPDVPAELVALLKQALARAPEGRFADAGRMYEALLAFLYSQKRRFGAHDLADFLSGFSAPDEVGHVVVLDAEHAVSQERTPVEVPTHREPREPISSRMEAAAPIVDVGRTAELGERREVTALVIELPANRASVAPEGSSLGPRASDLITRYGGRIVSREPEHITALFGVDEPDGRDTEIATRCALVVLRSLAGVRPPSAGLHVGRIHVTHEGEPTDDERLSSLLATARDLARVREGMCAISASAMRQVRNLFVFDTLELTGGARPGVSATTTLLVKEVRGSSDAFGRFVGRREELRSVGEMLAATTRRNASVLTVRADHGIGKTRLLFEIERRLQKGGYNVGWYLATCLPRGTDVPFSGIQAMLQTLCGIAEGDAASRIRQVGPRLRALGLQDDEVAAILGALGGASDGAPKNALHTALSGNGRALLATAFTRTVQRLCEDRPHALAWDVAHAMDADSFALLESLLAKIPQARVLVILASRAGFGHPLEKHSQHAALDLGDMPPDDAERLVAVRLGVSRVPPELLRFVTGRAGGHPQMLEETLKALVEARAVTVVDGAVATMKLVGQDLALPKTLRGLVASRIARLRARDRAILQSAAVLGDPINSAVLDRMTNLSMVTLEKSLAALKDSGFLVQTGPMELLFSSPIVREVVVDALPAEAAREMHAAAGLALESDVGSAAPADHASRIAMHLYAAGDRDRAGQWFGQSAAARLESGQYEAAARDYARALGLGDLVARDADTVLGWFAGLAKAVRFVGALPEATELCESVIARVDASPHTAEGNERRVRVRLDAGRILGWIHLFDAARAQLVSAEAIAGNRPALVKSALVAAAELAARQGDFKRAMAFYERMQSLVETTTPSAERNVEEHKLAVSLVQASAAMGDREAAVRHFDRASALLPDEPTAIAERHKLRGLIHYFERDFRGAASASERAIATARELGLQYEIAVNLHNLADALVHLEDYPRAYGALKQSVALCDELGYERLASHNRMFLAFLDALAGDTDADRILLQGIRYAEANDFTWDVLGGRQLLAQLHVHRADTDAARLEYQRLRELARTAGNRMIANDCVSALQSMGITPRTVAASAGSAMIEAVRKACLPAIWSQGVKLARENAVSVVSASSGEKTFRVRAATHPVAPTVTLYGDGEDAEWSCDCGGKVDPCPHVAAAAIAAAKAAEGGAPLAPAEVEPPTALVYRLVARDGRLAMTRVLVKNGKEEVVRGSVASDVLRLKHPTLSPTHDDIRIDRVVASTSRDVLPLERIVDVLDALSTADVTLDGAAVKTSSERIKPFATVSDAPNGGFTVRVEAAPGVSVVALGVARLGGVLRPLGETQTTGERLEKLPLVRTFGRNEETALVTAVIPELEKQIEVTITAKRLAKKAVHARPRIEMDLSHVEGHTLSVLPILVYGDPPIARVDGEVVVSLGKGGVPVRKIDQERALVQRLRAELDLVLGRRVHFEGSEATRFAARLRSFQDLVGEHEHAAVFDGAPIRPTIEIDEEGRFDLSFASEGENAADAKRADPAIVMRAWRDGLDIVPLEGGGWAPIPAAWLAKHGARVADLLAARDQETKKLPKAALVDLAALCDALDRPRPVIVDRLAPLLDGFEGIPHVALPDDLTATLREYQAHGVDWLSFLRSAGLGGVLADDMGLGKTLQTICAMPADKRTLVVCPKSVVYNWHAEIARFRPGLRVAVFHGPKRTLDPSANVTLTTYAVLRLDTALLAAEPWDTVVLDEAQAIKNEASQTSRAAFALEAPFRVALSGTPVENRLEELWSVMNFANPGLLGGRSSFAERYVAPIGNGDRDAGQRLRAKIKPVLLRRLKRDVLPELPPRTDKVLHVELEESERVVYDAVRAAAKKEIVTKLADGGSVLAALEALLRLRQAACHPALVPGQRAETSSKVESLLGALEEAAADGHKALVFSQWTSLLDLVEPHLTAAGVRFTRLDGATKDRGAVVDAFQAADGPPVLLASLKAGGTGLNLTAADHVFLLDPWWNPAAEDQAADRAHRMGQDRPVIVYRVVARDTVEERILALQEKKRALAAVALDAGPGAIGSGGLTRDELLALLD